MAAEESKAGTLDDLNASFNNESITYECRVGGATRTLAQVLVKLTPQLSPDAIVLDNACGTGILTKEVLAAYPDAHVHAVDVAQGMIDILSETVKGHKRLDGHVETAVMNGQDLKFPDDNFDASYTNCGIFFFPDPAAGAKEIYRTLKPGGTALVTCWKEIFLDSVFYKVQDIIKPAKPLESMPVLERWGKKETIVQTMEEGGFTGVNVEQKDVLLWGKKLKDLCESLTENIKSFVGDTWTAEEKGKLMETLEKFFKGEGKDALLEKKPQGGIGVSMVAWIAIATK